MTTAQTNYSKIALQLATEIKSAGIADTVSFVADSGFGVGDNRSCDGLVEAAFDALLNEIDTALPFARYDRRIAADWARVRSDVNEERRYELSALGYGA